jgi:CO/xanthine dehydrogenase FAD-binding subunit
VNIAAYTRPGSLKDALETLSARSPAAVIIAGGTDLLPLMRKTRYLGAGTSADDASADTSSSRVLLDVGGLDEIKGVSHRGGFLRIGGATSIAAIAASPLVHEKAPILTAAAKSIGSPMVRNRATLAGNLASASPSADTAPALLALDAVVRLASAREGVRETPLANFFLGYRSTLLKEDEIITDILIPVPSDRSAGMFEKVGLRNADAISVVCVAVVMEMDGMECTKARVALGAVAPVPLRALAVERALAGQRMSADHVRDCARLVSEHIAPIDDVRASEDYRRWVAEAVVARSILRVLGLEDEA